MDSARPASLHPTMGRSRLVSLSVGLAAAIALVSGIGWPAPAQPQDTPAPSPRFLEHRARFQGVWRLATPPARARQVVDAAIDQTVNAMNFFLRGIARDQLRDNTPLNRRIDLVFLDDERVTVVFDGRHRYTTRPGRTHRFRTPEGDEMRVVQRLHPDGRLEQVFETDRGTRWNVYHSTGEGELRIEATTQGMMMPQPLYFTLDYRRE